MLMKYFFIYILLGTNGISLSAHSFDLKGFKIGIFIVSQPNRHHNALAEFKKKEILQQAKGLPSEVKIEVFKTHQDFGKVTGHWTVIPLFEKLANHPEFSWYFFMEETTNLRLNYLLNLLTSYNKSQEIFIGHALKDVDPTIIHHFASTSDESAILYPHFSAGFFLSFPLIKRLVSKCMDCSFSIDAKFELAKFIRDTTTVTLKHESRLCLRKKYDCVSWMDGEQPNCGQPVSPDKISVAVKTCHKFHSDRVNVIKKTWATDVHNLNFFSDTDDQSIPTIKLPIRNVPSGHCQKTLAIMKFYVNNNVPVDWLAIVDDDTLLSFPRLKKLLACYFPNELVAVGERYGYSVAGGTGYDYLTGGSGMIFTMLLVKQLVRSYRCPAIDSPDDMIIGLCLKYLDIPVTHSPVFHQARPTDYSPDFLKPLKHISFHKYWMIDPYAVYKEWLKEYPEHSEL